MFLLKDVKYKDILNIKSLSIEAGQATSIVGQSGSGKTTILRLLNKLISCDSGDIRYKGVSLRELDSVSLRREVVMLAQSPAIFEGSVRDNLTIGLHFSERPLPSDDELSRTLTLVKLSKNLNSDAESLSGGEKQRLALARVLLMKPSVLLLDEPSSALDEETEDIIMNSLLAYVKQSGSTLVMVTHSKRVAYQYSNRIVEIRNGSIFNMEVV